MLEQIMNEALLDHEGTITIGGMFAITNVRFADNIDGFAGSESELRNLINKIYATTITYGMKINTGKTQVMTNCEGIKIELLIL